MVERQGKLYFFDSPFEVEADEYSDHYRVYQLRRAAPPPEGSWQRLHEEGELIGKVPVAAVEFDSTRRRCMSDRAFDLL